jgi:hypothetical protein
MTVKLRLASEPDEVARILDAISTVLDVATDGRTCPQRGRFGVRCYAEARLPAATTHVHYGATTRPRTDQQPHDQRADG